MRVDHSHAIRSSVLGQLESEYDDARSSVTLVAHDDARWRSGHPSNPEARRLVSPIVEIQGSPSDERLSNPALEARTRWRFTGWRVAARRYALGERWEEARKQGDWLEPHSRYAADSQTFEASVFSASGALGGVDPDASLIISLWTQGSSYPHRQLVSTRLRQLAASDDDPEQAPISRESIKGLCDFLDRDSRINRPALSLTPSGHVYAQWEGSDGTRLSLIFLGQRELRFSCRIFNPDEPARFLRASGSSTSTALLGMIPIAASKVMTS